jgi:hypothetical protein
VGFFGIEDTRGAVTTPVEKGFIERVEFAALASTRRTRIIVFTRVGQAKVLQEILDKAAAGGHMPNIATVPRRYEFVFDGAAVRAAPHNPRLDGFMAVPPLTSYSITK